MLTLSAAILALCLTQLLTLKLWNKHRKKELASERALRRKIALNVSLKKSLLRNSLRVENNSEVAIEAMTRHLAEINRAVWDDEKRKEALNVSLDEEKSAQAYPSGLSKHPLNLLTPRFGAPY